MLLLRRKGDNRDPPKGKTFVKRFIERAAVRRMSKVPARALGGSWSRCAALVAALIYCCAGSGSEEYALDTEERDVST
jgi:hypothetical protein